MDRRLGRVVRVHKNSFRIKWEDFVGRTTIPAPNHPFVLNDKVVWEGYVDSNNKVISTSKINKRPTPKVWTQAEEEALIKEIKENAQKLTQTVSWNNI